MAANNNIDEDKNDVNDEYETLDELKEEWQGETEDEVNDFGETGGLSEEEEKAIIRKAIQQEVTELKCYQSLARAITVNAKGEALLQALDNGFKNLGN